jgi:hypothetical protein
MDLSNLNSQMLDEDILSIDLLKTSIEELFHLSETRQWILIQTKTKEGNAGYRVGARSIGVLGKTMFWRP